ncbi:MAG TPA: hypothetical protein VGQ78_08320 [Vicinamibacteria bacterium]|jgi:hypothetical protein|nr:hypothetical protein [Vicinamibacteria bacterium]
MRSIQTAAVLLLAAPLAWADKVPADFRTEFEKTFRPKRTYAVVVKEGVPTTSIYGKEGKETAAHYSIDVKDGRWETSSGLLDTSQVPVDFLNKGEVMELDSISYKDDRLDMRMVSVEAHKVRRTAIIFKSEKREPVATNFKFFFPFKVKGASDAPAALKYVGEYLKPFATEQEARALAARMQGGAPDVTTPSRAGATAPISGAATTTKKEIKPGMTPLEVIEILGKPEKEVSFENKQRWTYPDLTVIFENGKVKEVRF